jgi:7,8-dihydro-6-hydroxymethylpterin dimethyltransferase
VKGIVKQSEGLLEEADFYPLPCAHPNCHMMSYIYRGGGPPVPITRIIDVNKHLDLVANSVVYTPERVRNLAMKFMESTGNCCGPNGCGPSSPPAFPPAEDFLAKALTEKLHGADVFRIMLIAFLDVYNFDVRRVMKCCISHVLPSGHVVPFCAYNTLYRDGFVPLPPLVDEAKRAASSRMGLSLVAT